MGLLALFGWMVFLGISGFGLDFFWMLLIVPIGAVILWLAWAAAALMFAGLATLLGRICEHYHRWWVYVLLGPLAVLFALLSMLFAALFVV